MAERAEPTPGGARQRASRRKTGAKTKRGATGKQVARKRRPRRGYCRRCDKAVDAPGAWPGACAECTTPVEAHPVPDVLPPAGQPLRVLFVGINPGVQTARARRHFANPFNAFWGALSASGLVEGPVGPEDQGQLAAQGIGITNVVTRATPGSADVNAEDVAQGRERLERLLPQLRPRLLAFVGKQAYGMATGEKGVPHGPAAPFAGAATFVLPSTSPANASVSPDEKRRWFRELAKAARAQR